MSKTNVYENDGSVHCIGNGQMGVYEQGPNVIQIFGPPYSSPSYMKLGLCREDGMFVVSQREPQTAIWHHKLYIGSRKIGEMVDFMVQESPCLLRIVELARPLSFCVQIEKGWKISWNGIRYRKQGAAAGFLAHADAGISVYEHAPYPSRREINHQFLALGSAELTENMTLQLKEGRSLLVWAGGEDYPKCIRTSEEVLKNNPEEYLAKTREWWHGYSQQRINFEEKLPNHLPYRDKILSAIDDTTILIKTQQSAEGGVLAGYNYHLAYVRDQYGVSRCLLRLGCLKDAKKILEYYFDIFQCYGEIHNAQTIGDSHHFHIHENDKVEITGYLIIQAFDYYQKSGDKEFLIRTLPMLEWAWFAQVQELQENMLPFNGDETYVAGGILPRTVLCQGSAESTLLFLAAGERLLPFVTAEHLWDSRKLCRQWEIFRGVKRQYKDHFYHDGDLITNRAFFEPREKRFLHGVCQSCGRFGWNELDESGYYLCRDCFGALTEKKAPPKAYKIPSVKLMPSYIGSALFSREEIGKMTGEVMASRSDSQGKTVGYDRGMCLYCLTRLRSPEAARMLPLVLEQADITGGWSEYYDGEKPAGTRYRPWESGISLEAILEYSLSLEQDKHGPEKVERSAYPDLAD